MPAIATVSHFDDTSPAAQTGMQNVEWQQSAPYAGTVIYQGQTLNVTISDISAQIPNFGKVSHRTSTSESIHLADQGKLITFANATMMSVSLDSTVPANFCCFVACEGAGSAVLSPYPTGQIDGGSTLTIPPLQGVVLFFDGTNWWTDRGLNTGSGVTFAGDLSGSTSTQEVIGILNKLIDGSTPTDGQILQYSVATGKWELVLGGPGGGGQAPFNAMLAPPVITPPVVGSLTWGNQGTASTTANAGGAIWFHDAAGSGSDNIRHLWKAPPATPWSLIIGFVPGPNGNSWAIGGITIRDSGSGKLLAFWVGSNGAPVIYYVAKYNSYTAFAGDYNVAIGTTPFGPVVWQKLTDDGTNYTWSQSVDGQSWVQILQKPRTDFLTAAADQIGIGYDPIQSTLATGILYVHWAGI